MHSQKISAERHEQNYRRAGHNQLRELSPIEEREAAVNRRGELRVPAWERERRRLFLCRRRRYQLLVANPRTIDAQRSFNQVVYHAPAYRVEQDEQSRLLVYAPKKYRGNCRRQRARHQRGYQREESFAAPILPQALQKN